MVRVPSGIIHDESVEAALLEVPIDDWHIFQRLAAAKSLYERFKADLGFIEIFGAAA
jgi:hypothetical protein